MSQRLVTLESHASFMMHTREFLLVSYRAARLMPVSRLGNTALVSLWLYVGRARADVNPRPYRANVSIKPRGC